MSVRAYITRRKTIWVNEDAGFFQYNNNGENLTKYVHESEEYCLNIWHQDELLEELFKWGAEDYTNHDFAGHIEIGLDDFEAFYENTYWEDLVDIESIDKIKKYFDEGNYWLVLNCY